MAKRKAETAATVATHGGKKAKLIKPDLLDADSSSEDESVGGAELGDGFKINEEYAQRFEHNKKREELQRR